MGSENQIRNATTTKTKKLKFFAKLNSLSVTNETKRKICVKQANHISEHEKKSSRNIVWFGRIVLVVTARFPKDNDALGEKRLFVGGDERLNSDAI